MSFSDTIKQEILNKPIKENHCKLAFLSGIIRGNGVLYKRDGELGIDFRVPSENCVFAVTMLLKSLFNYDVREVMVTDNPFSKKDKFIISIYGKGAVNIFKALGILSESEDEIQVSLDMFNDLVKEECCLRAFFRGLFISAGTCTLPNEGTRRNNTGYHLELSFSHSAPAQATANKLAKCGIYPKITRRKENFIVYLKSAEEIKDFIAFLPAPLSVLKMTELIINKEISNNSNRQKNCDLGNVNRQIEASIKQIDAINKIDKHFGLSWLKEDLYNVAIARKESPDETLQELATKLNVSKSCLNHRLRKIVCIANEIKD